MTSFNYSKWDNIEISDDETDCHPNIDKASWFRMKHRSRVEREDQEDVDKRVIGGENAKDRLREEEISRLLAEIAEGGDAAEFEDPEALTTERAELRARVEEREQRMDYMEKNKKWNIDNICHTAAEKTIISGKGEDAADLQGSLMSSGKGKGGKVGPQSEKEAVMSYSKYIEDHEDTLEQFLATEELDDCKKQLHENGSCLLHEHAQSYILLSCLEDEMNGFHTKMVRAARNSQILSHISELGTSLNRHPRDVVLPFFKRISEDSYRRGFQEAVAGFVERIEKRAVDKRKEMDAEAKDDDYVELSAEERMGPGGLDPVEVFDSLPKELQEAFESKEVSKLQAALEAMPVGEAKKHMDRCEASGLWVSNAKANANDDDDDDDDDATAAA